MEVSGQLHAPCPVTPRENCLRPVWTLRNKENSVAPTMNRTQAAELVALAILTELSRFLRRTMISIK
jgi:hypothetical protein